MIDPVHKWNTSYKPLIIGIVLSILLLACSYILVVESPLSDPSFKIVVVFLTCAQALVQMVYFLHLGVEPKPRWNIMMFFFLVLVIFVIIGGSMWIMHNLNYNVMLPMTQ